MDACSNHKCQLLVRNEQGKWATCSLESVLAMSSSGSCDFYLLHCAITNYSGGVSIRESNHGTLLCDIPPSAIKNAVVMSETLIRYVTSARHIMIAIKFEDQGSLDRLLDLYDQNSISFSAAQKIHANAKCGMFPDCNDPATQEFMLRVLYSDGMENFVANVERWLQHLEEVAHIARNTDSGNHQDTESTWQQE